MKISSQFATEQKIELGQRLREARESIKISQQRLADAVGLGSAQIVSMIESGQRDLKAWELFQIAKALHISVESLMGKTEAIRPQVQWRDKPAHNEVSEIEARFIRRCERFALLEEWCETPPFQQLKPISLKSPDPSFASVQKEAESTREAMRLGGRPACVLEKTLEEDFGVKIFYEDMGEKGAAFAVSGPFGNAILMNTANKPWRRNFSLAHELFHLLCPPDWNSPDCEKLADVFASALLLPAESLETSFQSRIVDNKIDFDSLIEVACDFEVSIDALLWRLVNLRLITKEQAKTVLEPNSRLRLLDRINRGLSGKQMQEGLPERFQRLCFVAYRKGKIGRSKLAEFLEASLVDLHDRLDQEEQEDLTGAEIETEIAVTRC